MTKCLVCRRRANAYIRIGKKSIFRKIGHYCSSCDVQYNLANKPYTVNEKPYTVIRIEECQNIAPLSKIRSLGWDLDPGPLPYQGNALPG
jgi:hypothetical protein